MNLTSTDALILLAYCVLVLVIGIALRHSVKTSRDFLLAGRSLPAWLCGLAFIAVSLGAPEVIGMGALGARFGLRALLFCTIGVIPAMLIAGLFMMPVYYGSGARSVPDYLRLRFDRKTAAFHAALFAAMTILSTAISMCVLAWIVRVLHLFDELFYSLGWPQEWIFTFSIVLSAAVVLAYVLLHGLAGAMYTQAAQFFVLVAGLLPVVLLGFRKVGGWSGLKSSLTATDPGLLHSWTGGSQSGANPMGVGAFGVVAGLCFVLGAGYWCVDFRVIQTALAAKDLESARRAPLLAAIPSVFLPLLLVLPGLIAVGLPTPHTTFVVREQGGVIFHEVNVVPRAEEQGRGLVPARVNAANGTLLLDTAGHPLLDYDRATPNMIAHLLPAGLLGLGLAALLASFMSGIAGNVTAFNTVFAFDIYPSFLRKEGSDSHLLAVGRWATAGGLLLSIAVAYALARAGNLPDVLVLAFSVVNAPLLAVVPLGMLWRRATGHGAFTGLIAGAAVAMLHHGLTLPAVPHTGFHDGSIALLHPSSGAITRSFHGAIFACVASLVAAVLVSLFTQAHRETELVGLVHSLTKKSPHAHIAWWKRPEALAVAILAVAVGLNIFFA